MVDLITNFLSPRISVPRPLTAGPRWDWYSVNARALANIGTEGELC